MACRGGNMGSMAVGMWIWMAVGTVLLLAVLGALLLVLIRAARPNPGMVGTRNDRAADDTARSILRERYANGEIDDDEYRRRRRLLSDDDSTRRG
jgi:putative membrane protein